MKIRAISFLFLGSTFLAGNAHSIAFEENFNGDYTVNFPTLFDLDHQPPLNNVRPLFTDGNGVAQPWWRIKDSSASPEAFLGSHSAYLSPARSNDWVVSRAIEVPTAGYVLSFDAQSYVMRQGDRLSDLRVYISETPVDENNLPEEPALLIEKVSEGNYPEDIENDFTHYTLPLDDYAGKTVWLAFANLNEDKDILLIDNVLVQRLDIAEVTASSPAYAEAGDYAVNGVLEASTDAVVKNWKLTFLSGANEPQTLTGEELKPGEPVDFEFISDISADKVSDWRVELTADGMQPIVAEGSVQGLGFIPFHRVLLEEATGTWCGNCPLGMYAMEKMIDDPVMSEYVVPVSVHISGAGRPDYMINDNYAYLFAVTSAPALRIDRSLNVTYFSTKHDAVPADPENPLSVAHAVRERHNEISLFDISGTATLENGDRPKNLTAHVDLSPAMSLPGERYAMGFILTENNVGLDKSPYWRQENYMSGVKMLTNLDGLTELPDVLSDWKYQDVAREVYGYRGYEGVNFPAEFKLSEKYGFDVTLAIPDTYKAQEQGGRVTVLAPAIVPENLTLIAYLIDKEDDNRVVNSVAMPLTAQAEERMTIAEQYELWKSGSGVELTGEDVESAPVYYDLCGVRVESPASGIYVVKRGNKVEKRIIQNY